MRSNLFHVTVATASLAMASIMASATLHAQQPDAAQGERWRGMGGFPAGGRGVLGTVTEVTAEHYTLKSDTGEVYTVHYSVNTRIVKQAPGSGRRRGSSGTTGEAEGSGNDDPRPVPQTIKPTDIKVGDVITAGGEIDAQTKSIGAIFIAQLDPERAKQMREMQANYGKTWLGGRITGIDGTNITIEGMVDHAPHTITVDENTSFRQRRESITLADIKPGQQLRADGALRGGAFLATQVSTMDFPSRDSSAGSGTGSANGHGAQPKPQ